MPLTHLNGFDLRAKVHGWKVLKDGSDEPGSSFESHLLPGMSQGEQVASPWPTRTGTTFGMKIQVSGSTVAATEDSLTVLLALLGSPRLEATRYQGGASQVAQVTVEALSTERLNHLVRRVTVVLKVPGVFFRDTQPTTSTVEIGTNRAVQSLGGSAPIVDPIVMVGPGPFTGPITVEDVPTGTGIVLDTGAYAGQAWIWFVDVANLRAWTAVTETESQWNSSSSNRSEHVDYLANGPLQITPVVEPRANGSLLRTVRLRTTHAIKIRARRAWA